MPGDELAAFAAAEHEGVVAFRLRHGSLHLGLGISDERRFNLRIGRDRRDRGRRLGA